MNLESGKMQFFPTFGAKGVRDVDPTCRCHHCNIMPDSIFSNYIAQCLKRA